MNNYKFFPDLCPKCGTKLIIEQGQKEDTLRLSCKNKECSGTQIKKLQKGFATLEIRGLGPANVEKFYKAGLKNITDVFNSQFFNRQFLIDSGLFKSGRALDKIFESLDKFKEVSIEKAIQSLQIMVEKDSKDGYISIGKSISLELGKYLSDVPFNFEGLSLQVRDEINQKNSEILSFVRHQLTLFEENGVIIKKIEKKKVVTKTKKISKRVFLSPYVVGYVPETLGWDILTDFSTECDLVIVNAKDETDLISEAKDNSIKVLTFKQVKLLFF